MKMTKEERKAYKDYLDRISAPTCPVLVSQEECDTYNATHPLPTQEKIESILREAGVL